MTPMASTKRVRYPNRTTYFGVQTGLVDAKAEAERVEQERLKRVAEYIDGPPSKVTTITQFKEEFGI